MELKSVFCHAFVLVIFELGKFRKCFIINNLHKYNVLGV